MLLNKLLIIILASILSACAHHNPKEFAEQMQDIERQSYSSIGVSAIHMESGRVVEYKADERFKMASTNKVPVAIYLLHEVQNHKILLDKMVRIEPYDMVPGSGLMGYYLTRPGLAISIYNLLEPMITISENTSYDVILSHIGGTQAVQSFLLLHGINDMAIDRTLMQQFIDCKGITELPPRLDRSLQKWKVIFDGMDKEQQEESYRKHFADMRDTTTARAMTTLLTKLYKEELLDKKNTTLMLDIMSRTSTGENRIKNLLPKDVKVAHKTGSWNQEQAEAFYNYTHDVGIITMPGNLGHIAISVYTGSHKGSTQKLQVEAIAKTAKAVYSLFEKSLLTQSQ